MDRETGGPNPISEFKVSETFQFETKDVERSKTFKEGSKTFKIKNVREIKDV